MVTKEDAERLRRSGLSTQPCSGCEAGACPHTVIREDPTLNIAAADDLDEKFPNLDIIIIESGGDNLASTFSLDLVDWWMFVIDVAQGDDIPRKRGPGLVHSDLLVINKVDLAPHVGVDALMIESDARGVRGQKPVFSCQCRNSEKNESIERIAGEICSRVLFMDNLFDA